MDDGALALRHALEQLTARQVPGISVAVVQPGGVSKYLDAGVADLAADRPVAPGTLYLWFSMTKIVTATAVLKLAEDGLLDLDEPVERLVPEFPRPRSDWPPVRVRHLLSHSAGLPNPMPLRWVHPASEAGRDSHRFAMELLAKHDRLRFPAGSKAVYSNLGYITLGELIARASMQSFEDYVRTAILEPLSMVDTGFRYPPDAGRIAATGYQPRLTPMTPLLRLMLPRGIVGHRAGRFLAFHRFNVDGASYGGLLGPVRDAARFLAAHLNEGELEGVRLLSPDGMRAMQTVQARGPKLDVGYGWFRRGPDRAAAEFWEHLGGGAGFWSMMRIYPEEGLGVVSMGNATSYDHDAVAEAALRSVMG
ncbi:MAG: serine hydrolase domain-containing protein [Solirubrobacterales bacterium]